MQETRGENEVVRSDVRPGLMMVKRRTLKEDGRYLLYYDFERRAEQGERGSEGEKARP
jgi:hypothetical protein